MNMKGNIVNPLAEYMDLVNKIAVCLRDCADELEAEIKAFYPDDIINQYPSEMRRFRRDMYTVEQARELLEQFYSYTV